MLRLTGRAARRALAAASARRLSGLAAGSGRGDGAADRAVHDHLRASILAVDFGHWGGPSTRLRLHADHRLHPAQPGRLATDGTVHDGPGLRLPDRLLRLQRRHRLPDRADDLASTPRRPPAYWSYWHADAGQNTLDATARPARWLTRRRAASTPGSSAATERRRHAAAGRPSAPDAVRATNASPAGGGSGGPAHAPAPATPARRGSARCRSGSGSSGRRRRRRHRAATQPGPARRRARAAAQATVRAPLRPSSTQRRRGTARGRGDVRPAPSVSDRRPGSRQSSTPRRPPTGTAIVDAQPALPMHSTALGSYVPDARCGRRLDRAASPPRLAPARHAGGDEQASQQP